MLHESINELVDIDKQSDKISEFMRLMYANEDCEEGDEDCEDILSPCCGDKLETVFGSSFPLKVKCLSCHKEFVLKQIVDSITKQGEQS